MRAPARPKQARLSKTKTFPAPRRGWVRNENLVKPGAEGASVLDNFFPTATGVRIRRGYEHYATVGVITAPFASDAFDADAFAATDSDPTTITAIMTYNAGGAAKVFAATSSYISDITSVADPDVPPTPDVTGLGGDDWVSTQFQNSGGDIYLVAVNGVDDRHLFDGSSWATTPAITGTTALFSHVWAYKKRLFFVEKNTMSAWYLAVDAIGGAATEFPLGGVFRLGGSLLFGATWSLDSGIGLTDTCVFVTTEGEVAVYEGTNPGDAAEWALKGVYRIGRPLSKRAHTKAGGDLAVATDAGLVPISQAVQKDQAALSASAISYPIEEEWKYEALRRRASGSWSLEMWPTQQMMIVGLPTYGTSLDPVCLVVNIRTGAWARYTGWDTQCLGLYGDRMLFGSADGCIYEAEVTGSDNGVPYTATYIGLFEDMGALAAYKTVHLSRPTFLTLAETNAQAFVAVDYVPTAPNAPDAAADSGSASVWGTGVWGTSTWGESATQYREAKWVPVYGTGFAIAPGVQVTIGSVAAPDTDLVSTDLQYEIGETVL